MVIAVEDLTWITRICSYVHERASLVWSVRYSTPASVNLRLPRQSLNVWVWRTAKSKLAAGALTARNKRTTAFIKAPIHCPAPSGSRPGREEHIRLSQEGAGDATPRNS